MSPSGANEKAERLRGDGQDGRASVCSVDMQVCDVAAQQEVGAVPCGRWQEAAGMLGEWQKFTADLVTGLLICKFCGRGAFGGTPTSEGRFGCMAAAN